MENQKDKNLDPAMLENIDLLLDMEVLEDEESWSLLEIDEEDEEMNFFEQMSKGAEDEDES